MAKSVRQRTPLLISKGLVRYIAPPLMLCACVALLPVLLQILLDPRPSANIVLCCPLSDAAVTFP